MCPGGSISWRASCGSERSGGRVFLDASRMAHAYFVLRGRHPLGVDLDLLSPAVRLGSPRPGDLVLIGSVGAYNTNAASAWAGPMPPIVALLSRRL